MAWLPPAHKAEWFVGSGKEHVWKFEWMRPTRRISRFRLRILLCTLLIGALVYWRNEKSFPIRKTLLPTGGDFNRLSVTGFYNTGRPGQVLCSDITHHGQVYVQQSFHLSDDIHAIAEGLKDHPMIDYNGQDKELSHAEIVDRTWLRMAHSSVWLDAYQVYLTITRVFFYSQGNTNWPVVSFLRGQIHDEDWEEQLNYTIEWQGENVTFPKTFDILTSYARGGAFYGPEDPRILIEQDVPDAEPVIVFNMVSDAKTQTRAMYVFRPFTNAMTLLSISGTERNTAEKNWMPFFYTADVQTSDERRWPNHFIHFVYHFSPLKVLKCHLFSGWCVVVYVQDIPATLTSSHNTTLGFMRGGTNFHPITSIGGFQSYVGFPRTHISAGCSQSSYRPELMILVATSPEHFYIEYASEALDFGSAAMDETILADPCGQGRILIVNSISKWDRSTTKTNKYDHHHQHPHHPHINNGNSSNNNKDKSNKPNSAAEDIMTLSFTVDDTSTQVLRIHGLQSYIDHTPSHRLTSPSALYAKTTSHNRNNINTPQEHVKYSASSNDVLGCSIESATNYTAHQSALVSGTDLRKVKQEELKSVLEQERKEKEEKWDEKLKMLMEVERQRKEEIEAFRKQKELEDNSGTLR